MERRLRLWPHPNTIGVLHIFYQAFPESLPESGAERSGSETSNIPEAYHMALVYYAASQLAEDNYEYLVSEKLYTRYKKRVADFVRDAANDNAPVFPRGQASAFRAFNRLVTGRVQS
jgi:hypothetical protein